MNEDITNIYNNEIEDIEKKISFLTELKEDNEFLKKELKEQNEIIESQQRILNIILSNKFIKSGGFLRKLQLHILELLKFVVNVCEKYGFEYWLDYGTLVGAFRHEGFVPWDDDIDVSMPRKDFEQFLKVFPKEIERFDGFMEKVTIRKGSSVFKNAKLSENCDHSPLLHFIYNEPFAIMEVCPVEYVKVEEYTPEAMQEYRRLFYKVRANFKETYLKGECTYEEGLLEGSEKMGITDNETEYMVCSIDAAPRKPVHISKIYPLRKGNFEGYEMNIPNDPVFYLNAYYNDDVTKIPPKIHHHDTPDVVKRKIGDKNLYELYDEAFTFLKNINENF